MANILSAATTMHATGVKLGEPRVYQSYKAQQNVELTLIRLGQRSDKRVLIYFNVPGHELHKKSFVYKQQCETTACKKVFFKRLGGSSINMIMNDGYYAHNVVALLSGEKRKIPLYYDKAQSKNKSRATLFSNYLNSIFRDRFYTEIKGLLSMSIKRLNQECSSNATLKTNSKVFKDKQFIKLLGMGKPVLEQIADTCKDAMYKEIFSSIKKVTFEFSKQYRKMVLTKSNELVIYLSPDFYNPTVTTKYAIDKL